MDMALASFSRTVVAVGIAVPEASYADGVSGGVGRDAREAIAIREVSIRNAEY
jgi:hypothetical protein